MACQAQKKEFHTVLLLLIAILRLLSGCNHSTVNVSYNSGCQGKAVGSRCTHVYIIYMCDIYIYVIYIYIYMQVIIQNTVVRVTMEIF